MSRRDGTRDRLSSLAASATRAVLRLAGGVWVARACGEATYGAFALLLAVETILFTLVGCLAAAPLANLVPRLGPEDGQRLWAGVARPLRKVGAVAAVGVLAICAGLQEVGLGTGLWVAASYGLGLQVAVHRAYHASTYRSGRVWEAECWSFATPLLAAALWGGWTAFWVGSAVGAAVACWRLRPRGLSGPAFVHPEFAPLGRTLLAGSVAYTVGSRLQVFVLAASALPGQVGLFVAALSLAGPLRLGAASLGNLLRPRAVEAFGAGDLARASRWAAGTLGVLLVAGGVGVLGCFALGAWAVDLLYADALPGLAAVLPAAAVYVALEALGSVLVVLSQALGTAGARCATRLRAAVAGVSLLLLWPACSFGAQGALVALAGAELLFVVGLGWSLHGRWPRVTPSPRPVRVRAADAALTA